MLRHCILNSCGARTAAKNGWSEHRFAPMDRAKTMEQGSCCPQSAAKKRSHLVIGESALLIADYFDWVDYLRLVADVGHQSNVTSTLDGDGQCALMVSAGAGHTAGNDLSTLRDVLTQTGNVLVIDGVDTIDTEAANLLAAATHGACGARAFGSFKSLAYYLLLDF